ncbi:MAG: RdgB/HAM1 family non-canonical purine NTP pyrophosphatase [Bacteroidales bacterium]|nr:RdgB/HAM1 family non-canonical purine NTP pyrophosphatase [Bacteroidales bacterium]
MDIVFATNNKGKLSEAQDIIKDHRILSLADIACTDDLPETHETIYENAEEKAMYLWNKYHVNCFSDDTGLEVDALDGAPGVYSARYAGPDKDPEKNMDLLLRNLSGKENRRARFHTEVVLVIDGVPHHFEGFVNGMITTAKRGSEGFGYDPVFQPEGFPVTMAEMSAESKNGISHRAMALRKMADWLNIGNF